MKMSAKKAIQKHFAGKNNAGLRKIITEAVVNPRIESYEHAMNIVRQQVSLSHLGEASLKALQAELEAGVNWDLPTVI
jgi:hypothetical protein